MTELERRCGRLGRRRGGHQLYAAHYRALVRLAALLRPRPGDRRGGRAGRVRRHARRVARCATRTRRWPTCGSRWSTGPARCCGTGGRRAAPRPAAAAATRRAPTHGAIGALERTGRARRAAAAARRASARCSRCATTSTSPRPRSPTPSASAAAPSRATRRAAWPPCAPPGGTPMSPTSRRPNDLRRRDCATPSPRRPTMVTPRRRAAADPSGIAEDQRHWWRRGLTLRGRRSGARRDRRGRRSHGGQPTTTNRSRHDPTRDPRSVQHAESARHSPTGTDPAGRRSTPTADAVAVDERACSLPRVPRRQVEPAGRTQPPPTQWQDDVASRASAEPPRSLRQGRRPRLDRSASPATGAAPERNPPDQGERRPSGPRHRTPDDTDGCDCWSTARHRSPRDNAAVQAGRPPHRWMDVQGLSGRPPRARRGSRSTAPVDGPAPRARHLHDRASWGVGRVAEAPSGREHRRVRPSQDTVAARARGPTGCGHLRGLCRDGSAIDDETTTSR